MKLIATGNVFMGHADHVKDCVVILPASLVFTDIIAYGGAGDSVTDDILVIGDAGILYPIKDDINS